MKKSPSHSLTRREFLRRSVLAAGALSLSSRSWAQVAGANSDIRMAVIGFNGRGKDHIKAWMKMPGVRLTALCDVDSAVLETEAKKCADAGLQVERYTDLRKLLDSQNVDAVSIATPNHWHATAAIWAMQSGRDVYVEKPVSYDIWEGEQMVAAAESLKKICQAGTQSRSSKGIREAVDWVNHGHLGKILVARGICYKRRQSIGKTEGPQPVPATVDYNLWTGPAPLTPPRRRRFHYDWHWFWNYGGGDLANQGVHEVDVARWFLGQQHPAGYVLTVGGRFGYSDDAQTPNTLVTFHNYPGAPLIMEVRGLPEKSGSEKMDAYKGAQIGVVIECEGGYVLVPDYSSARAFDKTGKEIKRFTGGGNHYQNFIEAVRSRRPGDLNASIQEGARSAALCHMSNISYRLGGYQSPEEIRARIQGNADETSAFARMSEHLAANGIDLEKTYAFFGDPIRTNPGNGQIIQDKGANNLLMRPPRQGFEIKVT